MAFQQLRRAPCEAPVLAFPDPHRSFILDTDASDVGVGAVLSQAGEQGEQVIAYFSRSLDRAEKNYCVTRRELLAVVLAVRHFRTYLYGKRFLLRTDHASLTWLLNFKEPEGQLARWLETLQDYDIEIRHRAGRLHSNADALSRRPCAADQCRHCQRQEEKNSPSPPRHERRVGEEERNIARQQPAVPAPLASSQPLQRSPAATAHQQLTASPRHERRVGEGERNIVRQQPAVPAPLSSSQPLQRSPAATAHQQLTASPRCVGEGERDIARQQPVAAHHCRAVTGTTRAPVDAMSVAELRKAQSEDATLSRAWSWIEAGQRPAWTEISALDKETKAIYSQWGGIVARHGLLYRHWRAPNGQSDIFQLLVPAGLRARVLGQVHGGVGSAHFGNAKTLHRLRSRFYWPGCRQDVELFVHCCDACTARTGPTQRSHAPLQQYVVGSPMERVGVDIVGPLPLTERGNRYALVAMDYFTKWPEAYAVPDQSAPTTAEKLVTEMFSRFGAPEELHSDQGRNFEAEVFAEVCLRMGIRKTRTTPLHPQSDGLVERFNRTLAVQLTILAEERQQDWDLYLPLVLWAYRTAVQESTKCTPAALMLGRELRTPVDLVFGSPPEQESVDKPGMEYYKQLRERLKCTSWPGKPWLTPECDRSGLTTHGAVARSFRLVRKFGYTARKGRRASHQNSPASGSDRVRCWRNCPTWFIG